MNLSNLDIKSSSFLFLKSAFQEEGKNGKFQKILDWTKAQNDMVKVQVSRVPFKSLHDWSYDEESGSIRHNSGKFFSIDGIQVHTNWGNISSWEQPIINQPEIGYLGFITKEFNGILHFLVQAKIEPGNINHVQISPTIQATRSNYTQVHKGNKTLYLDYFQKARPDQILLDQLQSEQGGRFIKKRNRNIIIRLEEEIPVYDNFTWLTLAEIKKFISHNNLVNMDTRTVISSIPFGTFDKDVIDFFNFLGKKNSDKKTHDMFLRSALSGNSSLNRIEDIITFLTQLKSIYDLELKKIPLKGMDNWNFGIDEISHKDNKYFQVIAVDVEISNREICKWNQPMVKPAQEGLCAFVCKEINGVLHFAVQAKLECGNFDIIEFAPTVQCLTGNYRQTKEGWLPFLDYVLNSPPENIIYDAIQSEEGGRFFREQNRNMIVLAGDEIPVELPPHFIWMTLNQLYTFMKFNNYLNVQARSLISAVSFV
jgi:oxidase EvaA